MLVKQRNKILAKQMCLDQDLLILVVFRTHMLLQSGLKIKSLGVYKAKAIVLHFR